ncbi:protein HGH1 homolog [Montipora foliosa]|uniref:protein HGH1 homolog n=1 Tax=Montipora foliosa TaxID=591990 RepID=UPI0035F1F330
MADLVDETAVQELLPFLSLNARGDVKEKALDYILGLSGSVNGRKFLKENDEYLQRLLDLTKDSNPRICADAFLVLVNLSAESLISEKLLEYNFSEPFLSYTLNPASEHAEKAAMILSNVTRTERGCREILNVAKRNEDCSLNKIVDVLCLESYNPHCKLDYLAMFISNLTQLQEFRDFILNKDLCVLQRLLPFTTYNASLIKRRGVVGALKNCCFETASHEWLLSETVDILPYLLLPLAGPEEFPEDDMEKLPPDLQYLDDTKEREPDADMRKMLLDALLQLCTTKHGREVMREQNIYIILRELFSWEIDAEAKKACSHVIQVLIGDEPEPNMQDLKQVHIPEHVKFDEEVS